MSILTRDPIKLLVILFIIGFGGLIMIIIGSIGLIHGSEETELKCVKFHSDKLVVIEVSNPQPSTDGGLGWICAYHEASISYYLYKGYEISAVSVLEVYLTK